MNLDYCLAPDIGFDNSNVRLNDLLEQQINIK